MSIWQVNNNYSYLSVELNKEYTFQEVPMLARGIVAPRWHSPEVILVLSAGLADLLPPDICLFSHNGMACTERALKILHLVVKDHVEILPLTSYEGEAYTLVNPLFVDPPEITQFFPPKEKWYALNILNVMDCVDYEHSEVLRSESGKRKGIRNIVFKANCSDNKPIFKISEYIDRTYTSDQFKQLIEAHKLQGLTFEQINEK